jgi:hypothetical protein
MGAVRSSPLSLRRTSATSDGVPAPAYGLVTAPGSAPRSSRALVSGHVAESRLVALGAFQVTGTGRVGRRSITRAAFGVSATPRARLSLTFDRLRSTIHPRHVRTGISRDNEDPAGLRSTAFADEPALE